MKHELSPGTSIDSAAITLTAMAKEFSEPVEFDFNGTTLTASPTNSAEENRLSFRAALGLPAVDPPFHPVTARDALTRWDAGQSVFTIEMGGLGPGYEQAIQILVFELIRDMENKPLPEGKVFGSWGDATVSRIDESCGGFSGAQVGAAKQVAYRAIRDGWGKMLESVQKDRSIQVSKFFPSAPTPV
jgi:hypothetical protein